MIPVLGLSPLAGPGDGGFSMKVFSMKVFAMKVFAIRVSAKKKVFAKIKVSANRAP